MAGDKVVTEEDKLKRDRRNKYILIGAALTVLVVAGALIGYFVSKKNSDANASTSTSNSNTVPTATTSGTNSTGAGGSSNVDPNAVGSKNTPSKKRRLIGYYGANAIANGVDIVLGVNNRKTAPTEYQRGLSYYCATGYYDIINLAFLNIYGGGNNRFQITFGSFSDPKLRDGTYIYQGLGTETNTETSVATFIELGKQIKECQAKGVKIVMSLGGDRISAYTYVPGDGVAYANLWYNMFLEGNGPIRPFGPGVVLDGIELDVEKNDNPAVWNAEMISFITTLRTLSPKTEIAIVPQCFLNGVQNKDLNVGDVITETADKIDYLIIQYYNNPQCTYPFDFNFGKWKALYKGPMLVGLAGDWTSAISGGFLEPGPLQAVYDMLKADDQFGGFSVYDVSSSNPPALSWSVQTYANPANSSYSKILKDVLEGVVVGSGFPAQGPPQSDVNLAMRCGGTWDHANFTCGARTCTSNAGCGASEQCFMFLTKC
ncbi:hypothetical protein CcCBS67573_g05469 [Chytriomyces confervae]|uniref:GH18 domain-containing protein n=1 Tax=Chytriomyces confervae TaxID=246404 RepID=A0A507FCH8_9FUNG|nr:hypothetical protein HDU80_001261 [Chytriomyces hyalinus]TPX73280.1 hypothetical protein CcCBS67573_g05469 [Chytriomyces confervae]